MSKIAYSDFVDAVKRGAFPEGEAENLVANHNAMVANALINLQQAIPCLQVNHIDYAPQSATYFSCGATVVDMPRGFLTKVSTATCDDPCDKIEYDPISKDQLDCMIESAVACDTFDEPYEIYYDGTSYFDYPGIPIAGFHYPTGDTDKTCRAQQGYYALSKGQLWVFPHIQGSEMLVIEWDGIKREWEDDDQIEDDAEVQLACEYYVTGMAALREDCDLEKAKLFYNENPNQPGLFQQKRGDLVWQCRKERKLPAGKVCAQELPSTSCG